MSQIEKLYQKLKRKPTPSDVLFAEADKLLRAFGFIQHQPSGGSSHFIYTHPRLAGFQLTIARHGSQIKKGYVLATIDAIDRLKDNNGGDLND